MVSIILLQTPGTRFIASCEDDSSKPNNLIDDFQDFGFFKIQPNVWAGQETTNISLPILFSKNLNKVRPGCPLITVNLLNTLGLSLAALRHSWNFFLLCPTLFVCIIKTYLEMSIKELGSMLAQILPLAPFPNFLMQYLNKR